MDELKAAVPADAKLLERPLSKLTAEEFLGVLGRSTLDRRVVALLPDKKKYELWVEEGGGMGGMSLGDLIGKLKVEKKKVELEIDFDLGSHVSNPIFIDAIATRVVEKLRKLGGSNPMPG